MSLKKQLHDSWKYLLKIIKNKNSFDIGFLHHLCNLLLNQSTLSTEYSLTQKTFFTSAHSTDFVNSVIDFLHQLLDKPVKKTPQLPSNEFLALIILDSIIFNLYARSKNMDKLRLNNSFFNNSVSMSMSQMSDQWSEHNSVVVNNNDELKLALSYIEALATNANFFKKIKVLNDRPQNKDKNYRYLENLLETVEYVLNKEKMTAAKETFSKHRTTNFKTPFYSQSQSFSPTPEVLQKINSVIFTNQLNKIMSLLSNSPEEAFFSLNRIYFMNRKSEERKHFRNLKYNSGDMIFNLSKMYVESFKSKMEMFEQSRNPLFLWMKNYLQCFYLPVFRRWVGLVWEMVGKDSGGVLGFYKNNEQPLERGMLALIEDLPSELVEFLNMLYRLIDKHLGSITSNQNVITMMSGQQPKPTQSVSSLIPVKRFFIYSFLGDASMIREHVFPLQQQAKSPAEIEKFEETCNYMINLFFSSSAKKYSSTYTSKQLSVLVNLSLTIEQRLDERLAQGDLAELCYVVCDDVQTPLSSYFIEEPILNYDYEIMQRLIDEIEFTPKDLKQFDMKKDFVFGGSREVLLHKDEDDLIGNQPPARNMRYMRKDTDTFLNQNEINKKFTHKRENSESPFKLQDREETYERLQGKSHTYTNPLHGKYYSNETTGEEQVDFLTWMTVGGNHNYKDKISARKIKLAKTVSSGDNGLPQHSTEYLPDKTNTFGIRKLGNTSINEMSFLSLTRKGQLKEFRTFNKEKVRQINQLYQKYQSQNLFA